MNNIKKIRGREVNRFVSDKNRQGNIMNDRKIYRKITRKNLIIVRE